MLRESSQGQDSAVVTERMELLDRVDEVRDDLKGRLPAGSTLLGIGVIALTLSGFSGMISSVLGTSSVVLVFSSLGLCAAGSGMILRAVVLKKRLEAAVKQLELHEHGLGVVRNGVAEANGEASDVC